MDDLERQLDWSRGQRDLIARPPLPPVAFDPGRIVQVYTRTKVLLEYLEKCPKSPAMPE